MKFLPAMACVPFEPGYEMMALREMERHLAVDQCSDIQVCRIDSRVRSNIKEIVVYYTRCVSDAYARQVLCE